MKQIKVREARKQLRAHLEKRGDETNFIVTEKMISYWWKIINAAVFNNQLKTPPTPIIKEWFHDHIYAFCRPRYRDKFIIEIAMKRRLKNRRVFIILLIHEMVHQWEYENFERMTHSINFFHWEPIIKKQTGLPLTEHVLPDWQ